MKHPYKGHYGYNKISITVSAPENIGIYYCGYIKINGHLGVYYVGRAKGDGVTIKSRLLDHLRENHWPDVTHFGYRICDTKKEAENLEIYEIQRLQPKYNSQGKILDWLHR